MGAELDLRDSLARTDIGSFVIPYSTLIMMSRERLDYAEEFVTDVIRDNPDYEFEVSHGVIDRSITIRWRKHDDNRAEARCLVKAVPRIDADSKDAG